MNYGLMSTHDNVRVAGCMKTIGFNFEKDHVRDGMGHCFPQGPNKTHGRLHENPWFLLELIFRVGLDHCVCTRSVQKSRCQVFITLELEILRVCMGH